MNILNHNDAIKYEKIAIISDVHGNLIALNEVLKDIENRNINRIFCIGDTAGKGPNSDSAVDKVRECCQVVVMGNWEYFLSEHEGNTVAKWHKRQLGEDRLNYLRELPMYLEFYMSGKLVRLCHAAPTDVFHRVYPNASVEEKMTLFEATISNKNKSDVLGYGDIHASYINCYKGKTLFNVGSVGNPLDGTKASYGIIEGYFGSKEEGPFSVTIVKVPYNIEAAIDCANQSDMPEKEEYINELKTGIYRGINRGNKV